MKDFNLGGYFWEIRYTYTNNWELKVARLPRYSYKVSHFTCKGPKNYEWRYRHKFPVLLVRVKERA